MNKLYTKPFTGQQCPCTSIIGQLLKYLLNNFKLAFADIRMTLRSEYFCTISLRIINSNSLSAERSCISSTITCDIPNKPFFNLSIKISKKKILYQKNMYIQLKNLINIYQLYKIKLHRKIVGLHYQIEQYIQHFFLNLLPFHKQLALLQKLLVFFLVVCR